MPKKPNRKELQNYIGAGNGDKSGEYTFDNGGGSSTKNDDDPIAKLNEDFEPFNPSEEKEPPVAVEEHKEPNPIESKDLVDAVDKLNNFKPKEKKIVTDFINRGDANCNKILKDALDSGKYKYYRLDKDYRESLYDRGYNPRQIQISCFLPELQELVLTPSDIEGSSFAPVGADFYHESGHLVDSYHNNISSNFRDENGNGLIDMLKIDAENIIKNDSLNELINIRDDYYNKAESEKEKNNDALYGKMQELHKEAHILDEKYEREWTEKQGMTWDANSQFRATDISYYTSSEYKQCLKEKRGIEKELKKLNSQFVKVQDTKAYKEWCARYGDIGDMIDGSMQRDNPTGFHHPVGYWNDEYRCKECFAECFSATSINEESLPSIKKYFPNAYNMFTKIMRSLNNGKK